MKQEKIAGVAKVIGISKLKGKYEPFEAKRQLCNSYDLFVADDRIIPSLPKLIGESLAFTLHMMQTYKACSKCVLYGVPMYCVATPCTIAAGACM